MRKVSESDYEGPHPRGILKGPGRFSTDDAASKARVSLLLAIDDKDQSPGVREAAHE